MTMTEPLSTDQHNKPHKPRQGGRKAEKKKLKNPHEQELTDKQKNPKAFALQSYAKALRTYTRTQDLQVKKLHTPVVDRTPVLPPPTIVAIVGGAKSGKSTLLQGLVKNYTHRRITNLVGPITIIAGRKNRFTFIEVNSDINCMIDAAKIADIALLLIDATVGIEFEIFEFMEVCKAHGSPRIMGVMNHLDGLKQNKSLKKEKKALKHRFQAELYPGAKMFFVTGMVYSSYKQNEMSNLGRFISVMKFRPLTFRASHPYILVDRWEDITNQNEIRLNAKCDRSLVLYGYVRGSSFVPANAAHIPGCGDFVVQSIDELDDPCPYPHKLKKRSLNSKERLVYAPMAGVSGIIFDKDAVYIDLGGSQYDRKNKGKRDKRTVEEVENDNEEAALLEPLLKLRKTAEEKVKDTAFRLFPDSEPIKSSALIESDDEQEVVKKKKRLEVICKTVTDANGVSRRVAVFEEEESDQPADSSDDNDETDDEMEVDNAEISDDELDEAGDMNESDFRAQMFLQASKAFQNNQNSVSELRKILYDDDYQDNNEKETKEPEDRIGSIFKKSEGKSISFAKNIYHEQEQFLTRQPRMVDWTSEDFQNVVRDVFATGEWSEGECAEKLLKMNEEAEMYGDFEDLETGDQFKAEEPTPEVVEENKNDEKIKKSEMTADERRLEQKKRLKEMFDAEYDGKGKADHFEELKTEMSHQGQLNKSEFENMNKETRSKIEGFRAGLYVRIEFHKMPCEFVDNFDPTYPIIVGGLLDNEENYRIVRARLKVHRYYHKILKNRDPLIFSLGWRRIQCMVYFAKREDNFRLRSLKYAKKYLHVEAFFYGPASMSNTGFVAYQNLGQEQAGFRIAANGVVLEVVEHDKITKKLKLIGYPKEIMGKTAYIKDMFHSDVEVTKFLGVGLQTQSTIRGMIKKASNVKGDFRAKFEDRIQMSDIIILKTWINIEIREFCICMRTLLLPLGEKAIWRGMRTVAEIKRAENVKNTVNPDHLYTPIIQRRQYISLPVVIPKKLQAALPYKYKEKITPFVKEPERVIVVKDPEEIKMDLFIKKLAAVMKDKNEKETRKRIIENARYKKTIQAKDALRQLHEKKTKKDMCRIISKRRRK